MRHQGQRPASHHRPARQLDLFGLPDLADFAQPGPRWGVLRQETRQLVTELMAQLLLDDARVDHRPVRAEAAE
jgi:hypothetical protein